MTQFTKGEIVYVNGIWNVEERCKIIDFIPKNENTKVDIYTILSLDNGGTFGAPIDHIFKTKKEARNAHIEESKKLIKEYKESITNIDELVKFPLEHCFNGEEYTDYKAIQAYKERVKELLNIQL
jgi:hypothetical protein